MRSRRKSEIVGSRDLLHLQKRASLARLAVIGWRRDQEEPLCVHLCSYTSQASLPMVTIFDVRVSL
jgi:hypothetical protein